jgi:choline dehydrogenase-like flavoprotein
MISVKQHGRVDYIVIGAGSAGAVIASRLSETENVRVCLIEAGGPARHPYARMPIAFMRIHRAPAYSWKFESEPEPGLKNRTITMWRGRALGGSSSVNGMIYTRGHYLDFDYWQQQGLDGWGYAEVLPYFKKLERSWRGANEFHGADGPIDVSVVDVPIMLYDTLAQAAAKAGHPISDDLFATQVEGIGRLELTIGDGERSGTARGYLNAVLDRRNLLIETRALTTRIMFSNKRAVGVEYVKNGETRRVFCDREVILSGGTLNSPQILMLSGIGPADQLRAFGIAPIADLPGVGANLQEHPLVGLHWRTNRRDTYLKYLRWDRAAIAMAQWLVFKSGPFVQIGSHAMIYARTRPELARPDMQFVASAIGLDADLWFPGITAPPVHRFSCMVGHQHPDSRGWVKLRSVDPRDRPRIFYNIFGKQSDLDAMVRGIEMAREIYAQDPQRQWIEREIEPGDHVTGQVALREFLRTNVGVAQHPIGTCRMGIDNLAVVDAQLRVHGIEGLRVADASVIPDEVGGNTNITTIMIGEKAADLIRGRQLMATQNEGAA